VENWRTGEHGMLASWIAFEACTREQLRTYGELENMEC
jgi:hypothetical protein